MSNAAKKDLCGCIFDIQSFSVHDGPGCRTTVFLKGCNLKCRWCANPESWLSVPEVLFAPVKCRCRPEQERCLKACRHGAITRRSGGVAIERSICRACTDFSCANVCVHEALRLCGKSYTVEELMAVLARDRDFWGTGGGVTFSGGEPFCQTPFLREVLHRCRAAYMHTAIETTANAATETFLDLMNDVDFAFIDFKHSDNAAHLAGTGVGNAQIKRNIAALIAAAWSGRLVLRLPLIPGFNDTPENLCGTADFMEENGLFEINVLPFHRLGDSKWRQLGLDYPYREQNETSEAALMKVQEYFLARKIACYIASETLF